jgi:hypothetical protein
MTKITYGISGELTREFNEDYTVGQLKADRSILGALGAPESVQAVSQGETLDDGEYVAEYSRIALEKQASSKA